MDNAVRAYSLRRDGDKFLTANFRVREFACKDGSDTIFISDRLPWACQYIRTRTGKPLTINSAYRTDSHNKAVGGEIFFPKLAATKENFVPDYITVAYGTNDWTLCTKERFIRNCKEFFDNLKSNYPNAQIFVITPIWRKDYMDQREFGGFDTVEKPIQIFAAGSENVRVISGFNLVNHDENVYGVFWLHPNDEGFDQYFKNLVNQLER